jgi:hypothetical protein
VCWAECFSGPLLACFLLGFFLSFSAGGQDHALFLMDFNIKAREIPYIPRWRWWASPLIAQRAEHFSEEGA